MHILAINKCYIQRKLQLTSTEVLISIGFPEQFSNSTYYYCPYQITGLGNEVIDFCTGVDSIQAITLTLEKVAMKLYQSPEYKNGQLTWNSNLNLGFPNLFEDLIIHNNIVKNHHSFGENVIDLTLSFASVA